LGAKIARSRAVVRRGTPTFVWRFALKVFPFRELFLHAPLLLRSAMSRAAIIAFLCLAAFDHYVGDDKGVVFIAAGIRHLFH
jgi:hypothetical protein